ncbi:hypothetical protein [Pseudooctadecabacter jejudonensis]|uniref:Uncharacterized protein n=1 Tax=Pseudooctadecabacter jejudonensis TaxID=1391910 RepID=A0A1Y5RAP1_9RHOB|nr:hypothetical protein [Pseudooctadecabacter jejudonensis]SLN11878.1 hypothetical protein PSJ8397_00112 [Pseudooctadecabacter jejudonensis]SLN11885.1 hypothetical protein PSJ8397_00113 [Pseudooctadecabacter jejudonensis]SLN11894.1 hypothetical protein PSJ8397_00114 [Pseudooctadecabacter jejudonensis]
MISRNRSTWTAYGGSARSGLKRSTGPFAATADRPKLHKGIRSWARVLEALS